MKARAIAVAVPLALGVACTHGQQTGAGSRPPDEPRQAAGAPQGGGAAGGATLPADPIVRPGPSIQGHAEDEIVLGRVVNTEGAALTLETPTGERRILQIVPETIIEVEGRDATAAELAEGQPVRASFAVVEGQDVAVKIRAGGDAITAPTEASTGSSGQAAPAPVEEPPGAPADPATGWPKDDEREPATPGPAPDAGWGPPTGPGHDGSAAPR